MIPKTYNQEIKLPDGRVISLETGKLAKHVLPLAVGPAMIIVGVLLMFIK